MITRDPRENARLAGYTGDGVAARYDAFRPRPPASIADFLAQMAQTQRPGLVVDLGSGTGLSTAIWMGRARRVIGIEPLDVMRRIAEANVAAPGVEFRSAIAQETGLPGGSVDIATCSQSFHHMEPDGVLAEVGRILRPGGVFATYDYDLPPIVHWEAERAYFAFLERMRQLRAAHGLEIRVQLTDKAEHADRMRRSGIFRHVRDLALHHAERCTAEQWVGFTLSLRDVTPVLALGLTDAEMGLDELRRVSERALGPEGLPWYVSYRIRIGIK